MQNQEHYQSEVSITDIKKMLFRVASENYLSFTSYATWL